MNLSTTYLGIPLQNPIIVGSSGLTDSVEKIQKIEQAGAGAVVLKSIFEEEIVFEYEDILKEAESLGINTDQFDYYDFHLKGKKLNRYIDLIKASKKTVSIPVIASINCVYSHEWVAFARRLQDAGADAVELNMFFLPSDLSRSHQDLEHMYFNVIEKVLKTVSIPVALKISYYFSSLGQMIQKLSQSGVSGLVLFNRFFSPDFDIEHLKIKPSFVFSTPADLAVSLRWIAMMSQRVNCDLAASTGVHDGNAVIKQLLAGAQVVQVVSALYQNGIDYLQEMIAALKNWMAAHEYSRLSDFQGKLSQAKADNPAVYERVQFMKYFS
ncbi:dihydroorotate dehydrogenase-like protein [Desulfococcus multivorans]|uniref:Dihydroorotate oxidase n=1 Tax=Desulfococcus multivorans DSM 2059 TaxID=1121405 RepID=S7TSJ4_DESML|nr:dihydroorotate dehydrogenase-like protein [Desulfococcus multivorans]AOY60620.1 PyrD2: dihydroorotate dehydrogenase [Desulfococcus multivorans]AQV02711.1 diguanylate cyclase [Desulfococcus multivorans]EPR39670.1 dihydroorotate oxidase [Desulfococcus multivorans DSM 2059]SKA03702.1 dihydroorotate dehydrogenase (fumarate) [Desulfococcus multivorans DSM 2059]